MAALPWTGEWTRLPSRRSNCFGCRVVPLLVTGGTHRRSFNGVSTPQFVRLVVAENGAVVYEPYRRAQSLLAKPPPARFVKRLKEMAVESLEMGNVILATWLPQHIAVLKAIQETGLELQVIFNSNAVVVLPPVGNKASGVKDALRKLGFSWHEAWKSAMPRMITRFSNDASVP